MALLAICPILIIVPPVLTLLTVYPLFYRVSTVYIFPSCAAIGFTSALAGFLVLREVRLPTNLFLGVVILSGVNLLASLLVLSPTLLSAGCDESSHPRPCGVFPGVCGISLFVGILAAVFVWLGTVEMRSAHR